jgi:hypothetical protein
MEWWSDGVLGGERNTPILHYSNPFKEDRMPMPSVGQSAPEFTLPVSREQNVSLKDYVGKKNVVLCFYPLDFTGG